MRVLLLCGCWIIGLTCPLCLLCLSAEVTRVNQIYFQGSSLSYNSSRLIQYILKSIIQNQKVETYVELLWIQIISAIFTDVDIRLPVSFSFVKFFMKNTKFHNILRFLIVLFYYINKLVNNIERHFNVLH